jgi:hypothetical protein
MNVTVDQHPMNRLRLGAPHQDRARELEHVHQLPTCIARRTATGPVTCCGSVRSADIRLPQRYSWQERQQTHERPISAGSRRSRIKPNSLVHTVATLECLAGR